MKTTSRFAFVYCVLLCLSIIFTPVYGEDILLSSEKEPIFEFLGREDGLSNLSVSSMVQDKYGFLWFGTQVGLNCYDGKKITSIKKNPFDDKELIHNLIQTMYYDEDEHELWIGTYQGVSRFMISKNEFINYTVEENGLSNEVVVAIEKDCEGNVWVGTLEGLNRFDENTGGFINYEVPKDVVRDILSDSSGRLLIGSYEGLLYLDRKENNLEKVELDLPSPYVMQVKEFEEGTITLGLWDGGVVKLTLGNEIIDKISFEDNRVYTILKTRDGTVWTGTWGGGLFARTAEGELFRFKGESGNELVHPVVYSMMQDKSGILWIGTNGGGINKLNPRKNNYLKFRHNPDRMEESLSKGKINDIFRDSRGDLWVAVYNSGLNRFDEEKGAFIKYNTELESPFNIPSNQILEIIEPREGELYLATGDGLVTYTTETDKFKKMGILPDGDTLYSLEMISADEYWLGTYSDGLYYYNENTGKLIHYSREYLGNNYVSDDLIYDILVDSRDRTWVATNNGLNLMRKDSDSFEVFIRENNDYTKLASNSIRTLFEDSLGNIWAGTIGGGVSIFDEEDYSFKTFIEKDGLPGNTISNISEGAPGEIWISTQNGIGIIKNMDTIYSLTPEDGIGFWEFDAGAYREKDGTLLLGGAEGIIAIPSDLQKQDFDEPEIYIDDVRVLGKSIDPNKQIFNGESYEFDYEEAFIEFEFVALDFDAPKKTKFYYKLEGLDKKWVKAETRTFASYSNVEPGEYQFLVKAETFRGIETDVASVEIKIGKPWYANYFAYSVYITLLILLVIVIIKIQERNFLDSQNKKLSMINQELEAANEALENLSTKDHLTGIYNRRSLDRLLKQQVDFARRSKSFISFVMLDIDNFKYINDNLGHIIGDEFLIDVSKEIIKVLRRSTDFFARFGGDEFAIILYDTNQEAALSVIDKINHAFQKVALMEKYKHEDKKTSLSFGVVSIVPNKGTTPEMLIKAADSALYNAKEKGKNRVETTSI